jgi:hypothetical protein
VRFYFDVTDRFSTAQPCRENFAEAVELLAQRGSRCARSERRRRYYLDWSEEHRTGTCSSKLIGAPTACAHADDPARTESESKVNFYQPGYDVMTMRSTAPFVHTNY